MFTRMTKLLGALFVICVLTLIFMTPVQAAETGGANTPEGMTDEILGSGDTGDPSTPFELNISTNAGSTSLSATLQILLVLTVLALAPSILIMVTSFTRVLIVLHFTRSALGTQTTPPNQILIGLALFLTFFIMSPTFSNINESAIQPFTNKEITQEQAIENGVGEIRNFMFSQTDKKDIKLFLDIAGVSEVEKDDDIPTTVLIPAFIISELRYAFIIGFIIYLPFIVIDMVVASTLMSMGMMMLPPTVISMPFKILLFILADGWNLIIEQTVRTFFT